MSKFSFGTDPEFMLMDKNGVMRSAIGVLNAKKNKTIIVDTDFGDEYSFYYDNVLAECSVPPATSKEDAVEIIREMFLNLNRLVGPNLKPIIQAGHTYDDGEMIHEDARIAGCKAEKCAYDLEPKSKERDWIRKEYKKSNYRTAGGHVHLGTEHGRRWIPSVCLARVLDLFVGLPLMWLDDDSTAQERRKFYGQAGRYRQPDHGLEYRTLSNFWLRTPYLVELTFDLCKFSVEFVDKGQHETLYAIDKERLASDDFWNNGGDPATCIEDLKYDTLLLKSLFNQGGGQRIDEFLNLAQEFLPSDLVERVRSLKGRKYLSLDKEWK